MSERKEDQEFCETVRLPGSMDENGKGIDNRGNVSPTFLNRDHIYAGPAVYQRRIWIPRDWEGRRIILFLERARKTRVWIDGADSRRATLHLMSTILAAMCRQAQSIL